MQSKNSGSDTYRDALAAARFRAVMASIDKGTGTGAGSSCSLWDGVASLASAILASGGGKLSAGVTLGASYKGTGTGMAQAAGVHSLAALDDAPPAFASDSDKGHGYGALLVSLPCLDSLPVSVALGSMFQAAGPLLQAAQAQGDIAIAKRQARRRVSLMRRAGATPSNATEGDAYGDGVLAVAQWRAVVGPRLWTDSAALVCWRAVSASVARADMLGESIEQWRADDSGAASWDWLCASALPLPQLVGDGSRLERAARLRFERARAGRVRRLNASHGQPGLAGARAAGSISGQATRCPDCPVARGEPGRCGEGGGVQGQRRQGQGQCGR